MKTTLDHMDKPRTRQAFWFGLATAALWLAPGGFGAEPPIDKALYAEAGTIEPAQLVYVSLKVPGLVTKLNVEPGALVKAGEVLAELDATRYQLEVARLRARLEGTRRRYEEIKTARDIGATNTERFSAIEAELKVAEIELQIAEYELDCTKVRAPIDGTILSRPAEVGMFIDPKMGTGHGVHLYEMADLRYLVVVIYVATGAMDRLTIGQPCRIERGRSKAECKGQVLRFQPMADSNNGTFRTWVKVEPSPSGEPLRLGSLIRVVFSP